jgi:glutamine amidotransferase
VLDGRVRLDEGAAVRGVVLADYGAGNLRSVQFGFARAGAEARITADPAEVREAPLAVIAGVGNAESAARELDARGLAEVLRERVANDRPTLGICLGMQLLSEESEEGGRGLGVLRGPVRRLRGGHVPHMGWNTLRLTGPSALVEDGTDVYFAHSFACEPSDDVVTADVRHARPVAAAVERGALAGLQFHPERSGPAGSRILEKAVAWSRSA